MHSGNVVGRPIACQVHGTMEEADRDGAGKRRRDRHPRWRPERARARPQPHPRRPLSRHPTPAASGLAYEDVAFADAQGTILRGWWIPGARPLAIVMVHPWGANRADLLGRVGYLHQAGYSLLLFDLSGHGDSAGDMRSFDWLNGLDVEAAVAFAAARSGRRVAVIGYSLGAALAVEVGSRDSLVAAVVEDSGFDSAVDVFGAHFERRTGLPAQPFALAPEALGSVAFRVNPWTAQPVGAAATLHKPLLVIIGSADDVVPPEEGLALYRAAAGPKRLLVVAGAGHTLAYDRDPARYQAAVLSFLRDSVH